LYIYLSLRDIFGCITENKKIINAILLNDKDIIKLFFNYESNDFIMFMNKSRKMEKVKAKVDKVVRNAVAKMMHAMNKSLQKRSRKVSHITSQMLFSMLLFMLLFMFSSSSFFFFFFSFFFSFFFPAGKGASGEGRKAAGC